MAEIYTNINLKKDCIIRGRIKKLKAYLGGGRYYSFQGIQYGQPPVGPLRFKSPLPAESWQGIRDAFSEGPCSLQKNMIIGESELLGDENCLYLNIYVPENNNLRLFENFPVMVWIHGGAFLEGSSDTKMHGPEFFMRKGNVILVTINYRLGPLGFISLNTERIPGNAGLQDQILALQWIQNNIIRFRGDPENVTIFGVSAGGSSVHYLLLAPSANGLFHRAIIESGSACNPWAYVDKNEMKIRTINLAKGLGCLSDDVDEIADFLEKVPANMLIEKQDCFVENLPILNVTFPPTCDDCICNAILTEDLNDLMNKGNFNKVPVMVGCCAQEGLLVNFFLTNLKKTINDVEEFFTKILHKQFFDSLGKNHNDNKEEIYRNIRKFYLKNKPINDETFQEFLNFIGDTMFVYGIKKMIDNFTKFAPDYPLYLYIFDYDGGIGLIKSLLIGQGERVVPGTSHGDEVGYLFRAHEFLPEPAKDSEDFQMIDKMINIWTNFAINGKPSENLGIKWEPYNHNNEFLKINLELSLDIDFFNERLEFWNNISKKFS